MGQNKDKNTTKNAFTLRIIDDDILVLFNELLATGIFESKNVLANKILAYGIKDFAGVYLQNRNMARPQPVATISEKVEKEIKQTRATTEDVFVIMTTMERLVTSLFNVKVAELSGEKVSVNEVTSGIMSELPDEFKAIKDEVIRLRAGRSKR